jgi:4-amino-4-deoxy-L-arabinose transferase-like glycosyltransferase
MWLIMAVTSLMKGLLGFVLPLMVIGVYSSLSEGCRQFYLGLSTGALAQRVRWLIARNRWFFNWTSIPAVAVAGATYTLPFVISSVRMGSGAGLDKVYRENIVRFFHPFDHRGPVYLYLYVIFALMAPWSVILPAALLQAHKRKPNERADIDRFALVYFWATLVFFTLSGSRRSYYVLPILPACAMLVSRLLLCRSEELSADTRLLLKVGYLALVAMVVVGAAALLPASIRPRPWAIYPPTPARAVFALFWAISFITVLYALWNFRTGTIAASMATVAYLSMTYVYVFAMPAAEEYRGEKGFGLQIRQLLQADKEGRVAFFRTVGPLFYMNPERPVPEYDDPAALRSAIRSDGVRWMITRRRDADELGLPVTIVASEATSPWEEEREVRNKGVLLRVGPDFGDRQHASGRELTEKALTVTISSALRRR